MKSLLRIDCLCFSLLIDLSVSWTCRLLLASYTHKSYPWKFTRASGWVYSTAVLCKLVQLARESWSDKAREIKERLDRPVYLNRKCGNENPFIFAILWREKFEHLKCHDVWKIYGTWENCISPWYFPSVSMMNGKKWSCNRKLKEQY